MNQERLGLANGLLATKPTKDGAESTMPPLVQEYSTSKVRKPMSARAFEAN